MKRLVVFVLLLAGGFYLLYELVGEDLIVTASSPTNEPANEPERGDRRGGSGVGVEQGSFGATVEQRGELQLFKERDIAMADGSVLKQTVFVLHAKDSQPLRDGLQQLDDVTTTLFEDGEPGAVIRAVQAIVELGRDANGDPSLAADKEISLTDVVFEALPGSRLEGLRLELAQARALVDDLELQIYTPTPDVPVSLSFAGARDATLVGKGLNARLPRDPDGALERVDVNILNEPVLETAGVTARARGLLHYAENTAREVAELSLTDAVVLEFDRTADLGDGTIGVDSSQRVTIHADQMLGWLTRGKQRDRDGNPTEAMAWRMLQLRGAPATVDLPEFVVSTPQLTVLPGLTGMPFWVTASGGISKIEQRSSPDAPTSPIRGTSPRRIHLLHGREHFAAQHRAFGFPQWALSPFDDLHALAFDGESHLEDELRSVDASSGLHVFQIDRWQSGVLARGFGKVTMQQHSTPEREALRAEGNDGFALVATRNREEVDFGPHDRDDPAWADHRYELWHGEMHATGSGSCRLEREDEYSVVSLRSPDRDIAATMASRGARLRDVRWLRAEFVGREVRTFDLMGVPATATLDRDDEALFASAPRIAQTSSASLRMLPSDPAEPELWHGLRVEDDLPRLRREAAATATRGRQKLDATAPRIDLHYMGKTDVLVDARSVGEVSARAEALVVPRTGGEPVTITFDAHRLRALPFALPGAVRRAHVGGAADRVGALPFFAESGIWILGDEVRRVHVVDPDEGSFEGHAHRLVMSAAAEAALLLGDSNQLTPASATRTAEGRTVTARGAQVRIYRDESVRLQAFRAFPGRSTFRLPEVELHQDDRSGVLSHVLATCRGDIDVLPEAVLFRGPVVARSIAADGSTLPGGLGIVAESLEMELHPDSGEVLRVLGKKVDLDWSRVAGSASEIELDLRWDRIIATDPVGARVVLGNGLVVSGERVTVNYLTLAYDLYRGRVEARRADIR